MIDLTDKKKLLSYLIIPLPTAVGILAGLISGEMEQHDFKNPPFSPPDWVFPVAWGILYLLMGISAYLVLKKNDYKITEGIKYFFYQLAVNFVWPIVFFRFEMYGTSAIVLGILILLVIATICEFKIYSKPSAWLLAPYLLWLFFALYLNIGVAILN